MLNKENESGMADTNYSEIILRVFTRLIINIVIWRGLAKFGHLRGYSGFGGQKYIIEKYDGNSARYY